MKSKYTNVLAYFFIGLVIAILVRACAEAQYPTVYTSYSTGECTKVVYPNGTEGDCASLPERYHNKWVQ